MSFEGAQGLGETVASIYRAESRRVLATLIRLLGDFELAEESMQEAFRAALEQWPREGVPARPHAWLISVGRFKAIDRLRKNARFTHLDESAIEERAVAAAPEVPEPADGVPDDRLRLIFTCCHPSLALDARIALTLRELCGLTTEEIAAAFLMRTPALAQRIVRAKAKIREAKIPYQVPAADELAARLEAVLRVVYLVFNEGYSATAGASLVRTNLTSEAIRLGRLLVALLPEPEALGLLALMLLQDSRRAARTSPAGDVVLLEDQDRSLWDREQIDEGLALAGRALASGRVGPYAIQAAIAAVHADAPRAAATDWARIVHLYDLLLRVEPSPIVELNRAVAVAMRDDAAAGLALVDAILDRGDLAMYALAHATRADFLRRLGRTDDARIAFEKALSLTPQVPLRRFLARRLREL